MMLCPILTFGQAWDYPIKPGTNEWNNFKSVDDMYRACQIPDSVLANIDTKGLVDICLNFPAIPQFPFFNSPQECFLSFYDNFNGIRELFKRKNAGEYLLKKYIQMSLSEYNPQWALHKQGNFILRYKFIETILAQTQVIQFLSIDNRKLLMKEMVKKMDEKLTKNNLFSGGNIEINLWAMAKLLSSENKLPASKDMKDMLSFLDSGLSINIDIKTMYQQGKKYAHETDNK